MSWSPAWRPSWRPQTVASGLTSEPWRMATWTRPVGRRRDWRRNRELPERREPRMRRSGLLGGSSWAQIRTPTPQAGCIPEATSIGTTKTCLISTDSPLAFLLLLLLLYNLQWPACHETERNVRIHIPPSSHCLHHLLADRHNQRRLERLTKKPKARPFSQTAACLVSPESSGLCIFTWASYSHITTSKHFPSLCPGIV